MLYFQWCDYGCLLWKIHAIQIIVTGLLQKKIQTLSLQEIHMPDSSDAVS